MQLRGNLLRRSAVLPSPALTRSLMLTFIPSLTTNLILTPNKHTISAATHQPTKSRHSSFTNIIRSKMTQTLHKKQEPAITSVTDLPTSEAKWVTLQKIEYTDQTGKARTWEVASRKTRSAKAGVDAVAIGNILLSPNKAPSTLLVIQYRPPLDAYTVEWPAGLIDENETAEEAAVREFREETGYEVSKVLSVSPVQAADPGLSNANMQMAMVEVEIPELEGEGEQALPEQRLEDGEHIERVVVPLAELYEKLVEYSKRERFIVAAKLFHFAAGMNFMKTQKYGL
ncbi:NUDIX hydrolase domain-like protein [Triangularia verruculosa]|uniref:NUDIX hydrolase domain-like protein n=1 Tax=Triangularia verruculosa TaxID=2587418 RepID=A0AAN6XAX8_9PEZI|nr:NUDIX hydrolase domain-like protein [Triangularia verruculosa]